MSDWFCCQLCTSSASVLIPARPCAQTPTTACSMWLVKRLRYFGGHARRNGESPGQLPADLYCTQNNWRGNAWRYVDPDDSFCQRPRKHLNRAPIGTRVLFPTMIQSQTSRSALWGSGCVENLFLSSTACGLAARTASVSAE